MYFARPCSRWSTVILLFTGEDHGHVVSYAVGLRRDFLHANKVCMVGVSFWGLPQLLFFQMNIFSEHSAVAQHPRQDLILPRKMTIVGGGIGLKLPLFRVLIPFAQVSVEQGIRTTLFIRTRLGSEAGQAGTRITLYVLCKYFQTLLGCSGRPPVDVCHFRHCGDEEEGLNGALFVPIQKSMDNPTLFLFFSFWPCESRAFPATTGTSDTNPIWRGA